MSLKTNEISIGTLSLYAKKGIVATANDTVAYTSASVVTLGQANTGVKVGGYLYTLPTLIFTPAVSTAYTVNITYFKNGVGFITESEALIATDTDPTAAEFVALFTSNAKLNAAITAGAIAISVVSSTVKIASTSTNTSIYITGGVAELTSKYLLAKVTSIAVDTITVGIEIQKTNAVVGDSLTGGYEFGDTIGEMTGCTLNSTLTPVVYKGLSKYAKQIEYGEGDATITADEVAFTVDNLDNLYGMTKAPTSAFFSGVTNANVTKYTMNDATIPKDAELFGIHIKSGGTGLILFRAGKAKTNTLDFSMKKLSYRTNNVEFKLMTPATSKAVWTLLNI